MKRHLRWVLWIGGVLLLAGGLVRLRFDVDVLNLLPPDLPAVQGLKLHQKYFANANELVITIEAEDPELAEQAARGIAEALRAETNLVRSAVWQPPWLENPAEAAEFIAYLWLNQSPEQFGQITNRLSGPNALATLHETRQRLATTFSPSELARLPHDPFNLLTLPESAGSEGFSTSSESGLFSSDDGRLRLAFVQAAQSLRDYREAIRWTTRIRELVGNWQRQNAATANIRFTGGPAFTSEIAGGMQGEMSTSVFSTALIMGALFWWAHRRWKPLLWLLALLLLILAGTMALGGWVIGTLNVVSAGFAAILFGLGDYGLVLYQEAQAHPEKPWRQIRREIAPSIFWSAVTTAGGFCLLTLSGLPGLGQLGSLVALGVGLAAVVMVFAYLPLVADAAREPVGETSLLNPVRMVAALALTCLVALGGLAVLLFFPPQVDYSSQPLRPRNSEAYAAMEQIRERLGHTDPYWVLVPGRDEQDVLRRLASVAHTLDEQTAAGKITHFELPVAVWPNALHQGQNATTAKRIIAAAPELRRAALESGFTTNSLLLTENVFAHWANPRGLWPTSHVSQWVLGKVAARTPDQAIALGLVYPGNRAPNELIATLRQQGVWLAGWESLGRALFDEVRSRFWYVCAPILALVVATLWLAFRHARDVLLSLSALGLGLLSLLIVMRIAGWSWNLLNMLAVPLLLAAGVDYSIHVLSALRRHGSIEELLRSTGKAILLVGGTTIAGFASLAWSSNAGLVSLGVVTASGLAGVMVISVFLLPHWWKVLGGRALAQPITEPSTLYRATFWQIGLRAARWMPAGLLAVAICGFAGAYWLLARARREIVRRNLRPAVDDDAAAKTATRALFQQFALKLADLWQFEIGKPVDALFQELTGWEHFVKAHARGQGVLLVTPHLGNWEFGAPLLVSRGIKLYVITLHEPGPGFTQMRQASRARQGIETLVIGQDAFAFVEIVKKLQEGATVAVLVDRPPPQSAVRVELFGRAFDASVAVAELARAAGCAVVPVVLPREEGGYAAHILPEIACDRPGLGKREGRIQLTQEIMRAFEPFIRQYITQWYHFVPIWPEER